MVQSQAKMVWKTGGGEGVGGRQEGGEGMVCHKGRREVRTWYVIRAGGR